MATFSLTGINIGTFNLGEADRIVTFFCREHGIHKAVAKGARKPGAKLSGKSEPLNLNRMLLAKGKNLDIITQCESLESFGRLRQDLSRLAYGLYFAELTQVFGQGLSDNCQEYFDRLSLFLGLLAEGSRDPALITLEFEFVILSSLGLKPELDVCVGCRKPLSDRSIKAFNLELGGFLCEECFHRLRSLQAKNSGVRFVSEGDGISERLASALHGFQGEEGRANIYVTPLVWKRLVLAGHHAAMSDSDIIDNSLLHLEGKSGEALLKKSVQAARRLLVSYIEYKAGRRFKTLELLGDIE
jgi:DNA repair protein RecO (recombination protein O)